MQRVEAFGESLDPGESEALVLAMEHRAILLIDEKRGRKSAAALGIQYAGLIGVLAEAKQERLIAHVKPILDDLIERAGFWVAPSLYEAVLLRLGER